MHPVARPAQMRRRHWGIVYSFLGIVVGPLLATIIYLWIFAVDQYSSVTGFTIRQEESGGASEILGGLSALTGSSASSDADILYEFIQSQDMVRGVDDALDLVTHYTGPFPRDPIFALWPDPTIEALQEHWQRKVRITFNQSTGLIEVRSLAFAPQTAHAINEEIVARSQDMINDLNLQSREDAMRYARADLDEALLRLKTAREALTSFRTRTQIVDPSADIQGRMGVMNNLQQQLAEALIEYDLLQQTTSEGDPRLRQAQQRITVIRARIADERQSFATEDNSADPDGEDYPTLIAEYEGLIVDREFAEETYRAALAALDVARAKASRQSRYLATYIPPTLPEMSEYPQRLVLTGIAGGFLVLLWSVLALVYYSIRDRG
ncbi:sugar transporter [Maribius pontilimi]|uniref:Sugar transporter n=1 Tax=Palleronia pontilimi TaxID=1964209 RepID=A0A934IBZ2_9RHOB|nr:sugar transporter [Palleronia pontilimi]